MNERYTTHTPLLLWPFRLVFELVDWVLHFTGRLLASIIGLVIMIIGFVITLTIVGAPVGMPMMVLGLVMMIHGFF